MKFAETFELGGAGKLLLLLVALAFACSLNVAFADDPYADYVKLTRKDTKSNYSWNVAGGWSDKKVPHSDTNYYVAPGAIPLTFTWASGTMISFR